MKLMIKHYYHLMDELRFKIDMLKREFEYGSDAKATITGFKYGKEEA